MSVETGEVERWADWLIAEADGPTDSGYETVATMLRQLLSDRAQLQAQVEAMRQENAELRHAWECAVFELERLKRPGDVVTIGGLP